MKLCLYCFKPVRRASYHYCSNKCQLDYQYSAYILAWKNGTVSGNRGVRAKGISRHLSRYLVEKYNGCCSLCGWNKVHPITGTVPLEIDHIDGNAENNSEENLRLLCPNCHALTPNFRNLNRGKGRDWRRIKYMKTMP